MIVFASILRIRECMGDSHRGFDVARCLLAADAIDADLTRLTGALTEAQFHAPTRSGGWSVGYCVEHLALTGQAYMPKWDEALQGPLRARPNGWEARYCWWERRLLRHVENPGRFMRTAPHQLVPFSRRSIGETLGGFRNVHREMAIRIERCLDVDVERIRIQSPFSRWLHYALGFSFDLVLAHERRHLCRAWRAGRLLLTDPS